MPSITLHCHPASLFYFLCEHIIEKDVPGLKLGHWPVTKKNEWQIASYLMGLIGPLSKLAIEEPQFLQDLTLYSADEDLLLWIKMAGPTKDTPPIS